MCTRSGARRPHRGRGGRPRRSIAAVRLGRCDGADARAGCHHCRLLDVVGVDRPRPDPPDAWRGSRLVVVVVVIIVVDETQIGHRLLHERCSHGSSWAQRSAWPPGRVEAPRLPRACPEAARPQPELAPRDPTGGRSPKSARPTRTMVDPSANATSRSSLIPSDRTGRSSSSASWTTRRKPARDVFGRPRRADGHEPADGQAVAEERRHELGDLLGRLAEPARLAGDVHLDQDGRARASPGNGHPLFLTRDRLPATDHRRQPSHLVALHGAEEVPHRLFVRCQCLRLFEELGGVVLPDVGDPGRQSGSNRFRAESFGDGHDGNARRVGSSRGDAPPDFGHPIGDLDRRRTGRPHRFTRSVAASPSRQTIIA